MTPKELARKHWEEKREDVDKYIKSCEIIISNDYSCTNYNNVIPCCDCPFDDCPKTIGNCWDEETNSRNHKWFDEYLTELKRLKENNMFKLGDKVEVSDSGETWILRTYICNRSEFGYRGKSEHVVIGDGGGISTWEQVRKPNTKRQELQEKLKQAEQTVKEVREELEKFGE